MSDKKNPNPNWVERPYRSPGAGHLLSASHGSAGSQSSGKRRGFWDVLG